MEHDPFHDGFALNFLADIALDQGRIQDAVAPNESSYRIFRELGDRLNAAFCICSFARALTLAGRPEAAARVLATSVASREEMGALDVMSTSEKALTAIRHQLDDDTFANAWELGVGMTAEEAVVLALDSLAAAGASVESGP
jgi:hypothetical protein